MFNPKIEDMNEPTGIERQVCEDIARRQQFGIKKYGTTIESSGLSHAEFLQHAYEECLDQAVYLKAAIEKLNDKEAQP